MKKSISLGLFILGLVMWSMESVAAMRRSISPSQPMWIVHIDSWNYPNPQKIIDLVPEDVKPYVVFNISLSSNESVTLDGVKICDSWIKVCARNRVWTMIQCSSGAHNRLSDTDLNIYKRYFEEYPNFLGFNFAEQFWDFGKEGMPTFLERLQLLADILKICHEHGGYLAVSFTQAYWSAEMNPIAYFKRNADMRQLLSGEVKESFICCEKYTMKNGFFDIESNCLGAWLGGYAGHYGIRFDNCGWASSETFPRSIALMPIMEHVMLTGETVIDGPELIPRECIHEIAKTSSDGYTVRNWGFYPQYVNVTMDGFRKILDGTVRIPTRNEVVDRTKICVLNDLEADDKDMRNPYLTPRTLFDGLYRQDLDQGGRLYENHWVDNQWWLKRTGRYPTIPQMAALVDEDAKRLQVVKVSEFASRWGDVSKKQAELNQMFPLEYSGDIFAGRLENGWITYNPYQYDETTETKTDASSGKTYTGRVYHLSEKRASGKLSLQYNTCQSLDLDFAPYSMGVVKEYPDHINLYLQNYRNTESKASETGFTEDGVTTDIVRIYGASVRPVVEWQDRANHQPSQVQEEWNDGVLTLTVTHNGALDMTLKCEGTASGKMTSWSQSRLEEPSVPDSYHGVLQYEAEVFDYKNIGACRTNGYYSGEQNYGYYGQGYVQMGTNANAAIRYPKPVDEVGTYQVSLRYKSASTATYYIEVGGKKYGITLRKSDQWTEASTQVEFKSTSDDIVIRPLTLVDVYLDCVSLKPIQTTGINQVGIDKAQEVKTEVFDLEGRKVNRKTSGVCIVKKTMANGRVMTQKQVCVNE